MSVWGFKNMCFVKNGYTFSHEGNYKTFYIFENRQFQIECRNKKECMQFMRVMDSPAG